MNNNNNNEENQTTEQAATEIPDQQNAWKDFGYHPQYPVYNPTEQSAFFRPGGVLHAHQAPQIPPMANGGRPHFDFELKAAEANYWRSAASRLRSNTANERNMELLQRIRYSQMTSLSVNEAKIKMATDAVILRGYIAKLLQTEGITEEETQKFKSMSDDFMQVAAALAEAVRKNTTEPPNTTTHPQSAEDTDVEYASSGGAEFTPRPARGGGRGRGRGRGRHHV